MADSSPASNPRMEWFAFYPNDWTTDERVALMSMEERGVYITLLVYSWNNGGLPAKPERIARLLQMDLQRFADLWGGPLRECWTKVDDRLVNPRQERERDVALAKSAKARASAQKRWEKERSASAVRTHSDGSADAMLVEKSREENTSTPPSPPSGGKRSKSKHPTWKQVEHEMALQRVGITGYRAIKEWFHYKQEKNQRLVFSTWRRLIEEALEKPGDLMVKVEHSIRSGYTGLFLPSQYGGRQPQPKLNSMHTQHMEAQAATEFFRQQEGGEVDKARRLIEAETTDTTDTTPTIFDV